MKCDFHIVDVFSPEPFRGNQLAVLPSAQGLTPKGMQAIAREFNFAETAFVLPPSDPANTCRIRIFTPSAELPFAGHPTVGTACALVYGGHVSGPNLILEEGIGPVPVFVEHHGALLRGTLTTSWPLEIPGAEPDPKTLVKILSLDEAEVGAGFYASVGGKFCFAQLESRQAVDRAVINRTAWSTFQATAWSPHVFLFTGGTGSGSELYARMFAPALGIEEDPATGAAAATLVAALATRSDCSDGSFELDIVQGASMGRRSEIRAVATRENRHVISVSVGGVTVHMASGEINGPEDYREATSPASE